MDGKVLSTRTKNGKMLRRFALYEWRKKKEEKEV